MGSGPGPLGPWAQAMPEHMDIGGLWGPFGVYFGTHLGSIWNPFGAHLGPIWGSFLGPFWGRFGVHLEPILCTIVP